VVGLIVLAIVLFVAIFLLLGGLIWFVRHMKSLPKGIPGKG
jgi:hypothetical protein